MSDAPRQENGLAVSYAALANLMYEVRRQCPRLPVLGISALHPRHSIPPEQLQLLQRLTSTQTDGAGDRSQDGRRSQEVPTLHVIVLQWVRCLIFACRETVGLLWLKMQCWGALRRERQQPATIILKTWCFSPTTFNGASDFYYGTLPQQLVARGISCLLLCGDTRERLDRAFATTLLRNQHVRAVPEFLLVPLWAPLVTVVRQLAAALALWRLATYATTPSLARVSAVACLNSVQPITMRNTLHFYIARAAVKTWRATVFVTLYEGQPWEQPAWHGAKAANPRCVTVGYQHTVIMRHSLALLSPHRDSWVRSAPDVVLCLGEVTRQMMAHGHQPHGNRLIAFGTSRRVVTNLPEESTPQPQRRTVLVVPETGIIREAKLLFDFAMQAALRIPDHRFIFRCHPFMPFARLRAHLADAPERFANIEISDRQSIHEDFARSSVVLYRGSSTVLYAVLHGLKPIYLHEADYPEVDPLFEVTGWRECVASPEALKVVLDAYAAESQAMSIDQWHDIVRYVETYATPLTDASVERFLDATGLANGKGYA